MGYILMVDYQLMLFLLNVLQNPTYDIIRGAGVAGEGRNRARPRGNPKSYPH
jgi:hypothetical protein